MPMVLDDFRPISTPMTYKSYRKDLPSIASTSTCQRKCRCKRAWFAVERIPRVLGAAAMILSGFLTIDQASGFLTLQSRGGLRLHVSSGSSQMRPAFASWWLTNECERWVRRARLNVNYDVSITHDFRSRHQRHRQWTGPRRSATYSTMMEANAPEDGRENRQSGAENMGGSVGGVPGYSMFDENLNELVRIELEEVPVERLQDFIRKWSKRRVSIDGPEWQGVVRPAGTKYGVPKTGMAVSESRTNLGAKLSFDGSPTDELDINIRHLSGGGSCVIMARGVDGLARLGGMGPHVASLVLHSEKQIKAKLEADMAEFAAEYHERVVRGLAPAAERQTDGEAGGSGATVLPDGTIDVTPLPKETATSAWTDKSAPPPVTRMLDADSRPMDITPDRVPAAQHEAPPVETFFADLDPKDIRDFDKAAFDLFNTMKQGQQGEVEVVGAEKLRGADGFFAEMRASNTSNAELVSLFEAGKNASMKGGTDQTSIPVETDLAQLEVMIGGDTGLRGGIDIFGGPPKPIGGRVQERTPKMEGARREEDDDVVGGRYIMYDEDGDPVLQLTPKEMASLDEDELTSTMVTVDVLINELVQADRERWTTICMEYTDLYLNSYYILSMRARIPKASKLERAAMNTANQAAISTVQELARTHQRLEMQQLEKIRDICEAALDDMNTLPDKVRAMKPLLDKEFVAYMGYAIQQEREDIEKRGMNPDREPTRWLQVLGVIQKGVFAELEKDVIEDCMAISHVLKLRTPEERFALLNVTIETLPSMYVRGFKRTATNIVDYYRAMGDRCMDQEMRDMILEMGNNLITLMSDERMAVLCNEIDTWAAEKAKEDSAEGKMRRIKEYEAEDREMRKSSHSAIGGGLSPEEIAEQRDQEELWRLTESIRGQNLLEEGSSSSDFPMLRGAGVEGIDEHFGDGADADNDALRRKLRRLSGPGGALEVESRGVPEMFVPDGIASLGLGDERTTFPGVDDELIDEAREGIVDLDGIFTDSPMTRSRVSQSGGAYGSDTAQDNQGEAEEEETSSDEEWGSFEDEDWRPEGEGRGKRVNEGSKDRLEPAGAPRGTDVPGLLGGQRFGGVEDTEVVKGEEAGDEANTVPSR